MTPELLLGALLLGLVDLLVAGALVHYGRQLTGASFRLVLAALGCQVLHQLCIAGTLLQPAEAWLYLSVAARLAYLGLMGYALRRWLDAGNRAVVFAVGAVLLLHAGLGLLTLLALSHPLLTLLDTVIAMLAGFGFLLLEVERRLNEIPDKDERLLQIEQNNRRLELQFAQAQKHESLGVMAAGIAHDFNNVLTSILGYTSLAIRKLPADSEVRKDLYMVMSGGRQAVDMTSEMLTYAGKGSLEFEPINLSKLIDNLASLVNSLVPRRIHLTQNLQQDLPLVRGDSVLLGQVLMNLVGNAVDATLGEEGTIDVTTGIRNVRVDMLERSLFTDRHEPGIYVYLEVRDSGVGMSADRVEKIFDPFYSEKNQGKGLGLSAIAGIVRQHRGFLKVDTQPGAGASFTVFLPMITYKDPSQPGQTSAPGQDQAHQRVLLADDDTGIRSLIDTLLTDEGYDVVTAVDGREALDEIETRGRDFQVFLLDCTMPKLTGVELYREIRTSGLKTPVILISGYHEGLALDEIRSDPAAQFLRKPFSVDQLLEVVRALRVTQPQTN